jgi:hypothetical protein
MADTRDPKLFSRSLLASAQSRPERTKLAHWPPPFRSGHTQPKIIRHEAGEKPKLAKPRGWRLTRTLFSEYSDD